LQRFLLTVLGAGIILGSEVKNACRRHDYFFMQLRSFRCQASVIFGSQIIYGRGLEVKTKQAAQIKKDPPKEYPGLLTKADNDQIGFDEKLGRFVPRECSLCK